MIKSAKGVQAPTLSITSSPVSCPAFGTAESIDPTTFLDGIQDAFNEGQENGRYNFVPKQGEPARNGPFYYWNYKGIYAFSKAFKSTTFEKVKYRGIDIKWSDVEDLIKVLCTAVKDPGGIRNFAINYEALFSKDRDLNRFHASRWPNFPYIETGEVIVTAPKLKGLTHYKKYTATSGVIIVGGAKVPDKAMLAANKSITYMLSSLPEYHDILKASNARIALFGPRGNSSELPEFKGTGETGGFAMSMTDAAMTANAGWLCYPGNYDIGGDPVIHEMVHSLNHLVFDAKNETYFYNLIYKLAQKSIKAGLLAKLEQELDKGQEQEVSHKVGEFWAMAVEGFIMDNGPRFKDSYYSRDWIKKNDPDLYKLITRYFPTEPWNYCPGWESH